MADLKQKTIIGVIWGAIEKCFGYIIQFLFTIVLARILAPEDFGIVGLLIIFTSLSQVILDSGFSQALIRKKVVTQKDYSAVFYFNIIVGFLLYIVLFICSPYIGAFYNFPELSNIAKVSFLTVIINSFGIVQNAKIMKEVNFQVLAKRTIIANIASGVIGVIIAYMGYGVWALVYQALLASLFKVGLLWLYSNWKPSLIFNMKPIKEMFGFSVNVMFSSLFDVLASNLQTLLIGKYYTRNDLGYYSQAYSLESIPSNAITAVIRNVTYPSLSTFQDDIVQLKEAYRKVITMTLFTVFPLMLGLMAIGEDLIISILTEKWEPSIQYFRPLCIIGAIFPLYSLGMNLFMILGEGKMLLKISIIKRIITIVLLLATVRFGVYVLVWGQILAAVINSLITMIYSGKLIKYTFHEQLKDIASIITASLVMLVCVLVFGKYCSIENIFILLFCEIVLAICVFGLLAFFMRIKACLNVINILKSLKQRLIK